MNHLDSQNSSDIIVQAINQEGTLRVFVADTTWLTDRARKLHTLAPTPCAALGRLLTGAALMSCTLKNPDDSLHLQIHCDGPIGGMLAVCDPNSNVRGYVHNPEMELPLNSIGKFDVSKAVGKGTLHVIKDMGLKEPFVGSVPLVSGEIAEDLAWYYAASEQIPTVLMLGVRISALGTVLQAGGILAQLMPGADELLISAVEEAMTKLPSITELLAAGETPESIVMNRLKDLNLHEIGRRSPAYKCNCSTEKMEKNLISLGKKELDELAEDPDGIELQCHFCSRFYAFAPEKMSQLAVYATSGSDKNQTLHD